MLILIHVNFFRSFMKVPINWLKEYIDFSLSTQELADTLTLAGIEVDAIERAPLKFSGVIVGLVLESHRHPNAEHLCVAKVTDGKEEFQVVCGAPNCRAGLKTAFAPIGATLEEEGKPFKIKKGKLRDVESFGMLCSAKELGLSEETNQIMELPSHFMVGEDFATLYGQEILEITLTPNLGHCMSIYGLARQLSALLQTSLKQPSFTFKEEGEAIDRLVHVQIVDRKQCLRYCCRVITGITVASSPAWLKSKIEASGLRSINNVVDVGNLVMLERGQPLHMFDYDTISQHKILIHSQTPYKELTTLDDVTRPIPPEALLICDADKPLAFAGIMGGQSSAVTDKTTNVLIESGYFTPQSVRQACKFLGLKTDGARLWERGVDPEGTLFALDYATYLLQRLAGGVIAKGAVDQKVHEFHPKRINCRIKRVNALLGTSLSLREVATMLERLGMHVVEERPHELLLAVPPYRHDITLEEDLIEEVAILYGYNNIEKVLPSHISSTIPQAPLYVFESDVRRRLIGEGLQEFLNCDLISPEQAGMMCENTLSQDAWIEVLHSKSAENSILRASLMPGLLQSIKYNVDRSQPDVAAFEIGHIYFKEGSSYQEQPTIGIVLTGKRTPYHWNPKPDAFDFFDLKGIVDNLCEGLKLSGITLEPSHLHTLHPGRQARIKRGGQILGTMGEVHPSYLRKVGVDQRVYFAELNSQDILQHQPVQGKIQDVPLYPGSERDWTLTVKQELTLQQALDAIGKSASPLLETFYLLDLYKSEQIGKDKKNVTFRFLYRDAHKTLAYETVDREHNRLIQTVTERLKEYIP